ncbi:hypothetical protein [Alteromonas sp. H39]|uniref:hypothetical protein n=1 Tax=Alteromonas sp. H39 TaxID=3389876 RepID=UPI0039E05C59
MLFLTVLFVIVLLLLAFALTKDKGQNTVYARGKGKPEATRRKLPIASLTEDTDTLQVN